MNQNQTDAVLAAYSALADILVARDADGDLLVENIDFDNVVEAVAALEEAFPHLERSGEYEEPETDDREALASAGRGTDEDYGFGEQIG